MNSAVESLVSRQVAGPPPSGAPRGKTSKKGAARRAKAVLGPWLRAQSINVTRHAAALRPFRRAEFGNTAAAPSEGHIQAVNSLIGSLRGGLLRMSAQVTRAIKAGAAPTPVPSTCRR